MRPLDLVGQQFGKLRVIALVPVPRAWVCRCACGEHSVVTTGRLRSGNTRSCGCHKRNVLGRSTTKHGMAHTPVHRVWTSMRARCNNPNARSYKNYGGRGIKVCKRWDDFAKFAKDMGPRPAGMTIERLNNDGNYTPRNCVWATRAQQSLNTRRTVHKERL